MKEETQRNWEIIIKIIALLFVIIGVPIGFYNQQEIKKQEFRFYEWKERLHIYKDLMDSISEIATANDLNEAKEPIKKFNKIYYGSATLVIDEKVMDAITPFAKEFIIPEEVKKIKWDDKFIEKLAGYQNEINGALRRHLKEVLEDIRPPF